MKLVQDVCELHMFVSTLGLSTRICAGYSERTILMYDNSNDIEDNHNMCPLYINPYTIQGRTYKNIHCLPSNMLTTLDKDGCFVPSANDFLNGFPISFIFNTHEKNAPTISNKNKVR